MKDTNYKTESYDISLKQLKTPQIIGCSSFYVKDGVNFKIEIPIISQTNIFHVRFVAEPKNKLPIKVKIEAKISNLSKDNERKQSLSLTQEAPSQKLYFIQLSKIIEELEKKSEKFLRINVGIGPPEEIAEEPNKNNNNQPHKSSMDNLFAQSSKNIASNQYNKPSNNLTNDQFGQSSKNLTNNQYNKPSNNLTNDQFGHQSNKIPEDNLFNRSIKPNYNNKDSYYNADDDSDSDDYANTKPTNRTDSENLKYYGLYNQGATCYINSAIQSFFHLPIFRKIIYDIPTNNETDPAHSLPLNLQCLFYNLQFGKSTCSTKMLTTSLGFERSDVYIQQDIEEFIKNLITTLDDQLKKIPNMKDRISSVFEGKTIQLIKDRGQRELNRSEDVFFEISVDVKPTLEDSLKRFTKEEIISDYTSSKDPTPQDVYYKTLFLTLPKVLFIYIKRYKFNVAKGYAEKNDNEMSYGEDLDLAPFMYRSSNQCTKFKLYGVIVHSGMATGGHYYMYCKPELKDKWYEFNDTIVQVVKSKEAIEGNFGGTESYRYYPSWKKEYSAYMLIYVRNDSIDEVFKPIDINQIPQSVLSYADQVNKNELTKKKSDPSLQISFTIYNEKGVWDNCKKGEMSSIINKKYFIKVTADQRSTANELYQAVADEMKINIDSLRLWILLDKGTTFHKVLDTDTPVKNIRTQEFFAQIKDKSEQLVPSYNERTYFLILYTRCPHPYFLLKIKTYKLSSSSYDTRTLKYENIIKDAISILNTNLNLKIQPDDATVSIIKDQSIVDKSSYLTCHEDNGSVMIIQINNPRITIDDTSLKDLKNKLNTKCNFSNAKITDPDTTTAHYNYADFMINQIPQNAKDYYKLKSKTIKSHIYNFINISQCKGTIEFPADVKPESLTSFIQISFSIPIIERTEMLLLFGREENINAPRSKPFNIIYGDKAPNLDNIYYCVADKKTVQDPLSETRVIQLSKDALTISKIVCYYKNNNDVIPFDTFVVYNETFFNNAKTRKFLVDKDNHAGPILNKNGADDDPYKLNNKSRLRIEIIPDDQDGKELILVYKCFVDGHTIQMFEEPFYFTYIKDEPVSDFKSRISKFLKIRNKFKVFKPSVKNSTLYYEQYIVRDKISFYDDKCLYLIFEIE